jgi:hypothetical protein
VTAVQETNCGRCHVAVGRLLLVCGLEGRYGRGYEEADGAWNDRCGVVAMMSVMAMAMLVVMMITLLIHLGMRSSASLLKKLKMSPNLSSGKIISIVE